MDFGSRPGGYQKRRVNHVLTAIPMVRIHCWKCDASYLLEQIENECIMYCCKCGTPGVVQHRDDYVPMHHKMKAYRLGEGLTQRELASQLGITREHYCNLEKNGCGRISGDLLQRITALLDPGHVDRHIGQFSGPNQKRAGKSQRGKRPKEKPASEKKTGSKIDSSRVIAS